MNTRHNIILNTDSYKASHYLQYPPKTEYVYSYIESRGSTGDENVYDSLDRPLRIPETVFFGLQAFLKEYLSKRIEQEDIDEAEIFWEAHGEPFNKEGWQYILEKHGGYLPIEIKAVPEGTVVPTGNALVSVVNTDPNCYWLTSYIETALLRAIWYPTTVATTSWRIKQVLKFYADLTSDLGNDPLNFKLHDFGARGVSSEESAALGGMAHLVNFMGTDTVSGALAAMRYYNSPAEMPGFSIPAAEHSSITTWGKEGELDAYRNMLTQFAKPGSLVAVVSDSYDIIAACRDIWGGKLKQEVIDSGATVIIRPDSGDPVSTVVNVLSTLEGAFGSTTNSKGYKVLNTVRVIQGDGIDERSIRAILKAMVINKYSIDNVAFGMGGALLQHMNRDTLKFAMKASAAMVDGKWVDVFKDPVTDSGKKSKKGKVEYVENTESGERYTTNDLSHPYTKSLMEVVFRNGEIIKQYNFREVRENSNK